MEPNTTINAMFETSDDVDVFVLPQAKARYRYTAAFTSADGVLVDVTVLDQAGNQLAFGGATATAVWIAEGQQAYYVIVDTRGQTGSYALQFIERRPPVGEIFATDDHPNAVPQGTLVNTPVLGSPVDITGVFETAGDTDVFRFVTGTAGFYDVWIVTPNTLTIEVVDAAGDPPADVYVGGNFVSWTSDPNKTWYIKVSGTGTGRYEIRLWVPDV